MKFSIKSNNLQSYYTTCLIVGIFEQSCLSKIAEEIDKISNGYLSVILKQETLEKKIGKTLLLHYIPNIFSKRILLVFCGKEHEFDERKYKVVINKSIEAINDTGSIEAVSFLTDLPVKNRDVYWKVRQAIEVTEEVLYTFDQFKSNKLKIQHLLENIIFNFSNKKDLIIAKDAMKHAIAITKGIRLAKDLGNMPPNICNANYLSSRASELANLFSSHINSQVISKEDMKALGMNAYLAVGNGSKNKTLMSIIEYKYNSQLNIKPIILVGKGVTFDSGGISIKSAGNMNEMKYDMCGAATVFGVMRVIADLHLPLHVIGVLACSENMLSSKSYRPGDILTTMSGKTVEVLNTDAEGRLVLCDALTYIERFHPELVIDIATLTGACVIALGHHMTGLMSNNNNLANQLLNAANQASDHLWRLPITDEYYEQLNSNFADVANVGGKEGGAITAACFLSEFTKKYIWAHLDIAGTAWYSGKNKRATGRPVALLSQFLLNKSKLNSSY
ncbi:Cytosol aminopeptidase [Candidatus Ecksteinia adelgidicola]|nr:Cytosol aminopeptidase [Candidatus Ecksteinia adelgidicola]